MAFNLSKFGSNKLKKLEENFKKSLDSKKEKSKKKRALKKKPVKMISEKSPDEMSKRDFDVLEHKIEMLKEFETELNSLDTKHFSVEAASIRAKLKDVSKLPQIDREMKMLKLKIKEKEREQEKKDVKVDYDVDVMIDNDFNDFLSGIKAAVSQRIRSREQEVEERLNYDLLSRDKKYRQKHLDLIKEFDAKKRKLEGEYKKRYNLDVKINLKKEVSERFERLLKQRLAKEKIILEKELKQKIREDELKILKADKEKMEKEREKFIHALEIEKDELEKEKKRFILMKENEKKKLFQREIAKKLKELENKLKVEFEAKYKKKLQEHEEEMKKKLAQVLRTD
ncbi:MAG: hypothetical protein Q8P15_03260 [Nanoarchaeota archaeon]|nr:hypothetical protein [Nanoarchaeota archaeon]